MVTSLMVAHIAGLNSMTTLQPTASPAAISAETAKVSLEGSRRGVWKSFREIPSSGYIWMVYADPDVVWGKEYPVEIHDDQYIGRSTKVIFYFYTRNPRPQTIHLKLQRPFNSDTISEETIIL